MSCWVSRRIDSKPVNSRLDDSRPVNSRPVYSKPVDSILVDFRPNDSRLIDEITCSQIFCLVNFKQVLINDFNRKKDAVLLFPSKLSDRITRSAVQ